MKITDIELRKAICGNCGKFMSETDRFCRFCGAQRGQGEYEFDHDPFEMHIIYGPRPITRTHLCKKCGHSWETVLMVDKEAHCPKCGGPAPITREDDY